MIYMKKTNNDSELDNKLADFTDRVLAGKSGQLDSNADEELQGLEETILRLKRAMPQIEASKSKLEQIESRLAARLRNEEKNMALPFWRKWFEWNRKYGKFRPQVAVMVGLLVVIALAWLGTLFFPVNGSVVSAAAIARSRTALTALALIGLILLLGWINRSK